MNGHRQSSVDVAGEPFGGIVSLEAFGPCFNTNDLRLGVLPLLQSLD